MPKMITWSLGLVLTLAAVAQAQSEAPGNKNANDVRNTQHGAYLYDILVAIHDEDLGLNLEQVDEAARTHLKLPKGQGLIATLVPSQGPAAQAGICENDILLTLNDAPLATPGDLKDRLKAAGDKPGNLVLLHRGQKKTLQVQPRYKITFGPVQPVPPEFWIGVSVTSLEPALRAQLQIPADQGLIATSVMNDGPAAKAGFKVNDILLSINDKHLGDQAELAKLVQQNGEKPLAVEIVREGSRRKIEVTPERRKGLNALASEVQFTGNLNFVRPGALIQGNRMGLITTPELTWNTNESTWFDAIEMQDTRPSKADSQPHAVPLANRLDSMAAEIKELRKAVEELSKVLKDRK